MSTYTKKEITQWLQRLVDEYERPLASGPRVATEGPYNQSIFWIVDGDRTFRVQVSIERAEAE